MTLSNRSQLLIASLIVCAGVGIMGLPLFGGLTLAFGIVIAAFGMGIQSPVALLSAAAERPSGEGRATASVPLARSIGGGIGIAVAGALVVRTVGRDVMNGAEQATSAVPTIAAAVQHSNLLLAGICLVSLPAVLLLRRD